jgi:hypothetical protein
MDALATQAADDRTTETTSPFLGSGYLTVDAPVADPVREGPIRSLRSPFAEALVDGAAVTERDDMEFLVAELQSESFDDAVEALVDEAAALHLSVPWASEATAGPATLQAWASQLTTDTGRLLDGLAERFDGRAIESITEAEIDGAAAHLMIGDYSPAAEQLFGGIVNKFKKAAGAVAKAGLGVLTKFTGLGQIAGILKKLVEPMVRRVVAKAIGRLPAAVQGPARQLAQRLGIPVAGERADEETGTDEMRSGAELVRDFDRQLAEALTAPDPTTIEQLLLAAEAAAEPSNEDPITELDAARARLTEDLLDAAPGEAPVVAVERFIPAVMAAMPLIRTAVKIIGRDRIKRIIAEPLALFIGKLIGRPAARALAPHIADAGMRLLHLEHEDRATLGAEAMVSAIEETVRQVLSLPAESLADDLRVGAEVQEAFAEAAADYLPGRMLRGDLEAAGTEEANEGWVLMPRAARPHYRFRAHTRPYRIVVDRPTARTIVFAEDETLEDRLLEDGVPAWPAEVEVRLFEALPGTRYGHLRLGDEEDTPQAGEFAELTPEAAGMLLRNAGLGRRAAGRGRRFFQVVTPGRHRRRRVRRFRLLLDTTSGAPVLRLHLHLGEQAAHTLAGQLGQKAHTQVVATFRRMLGPGARNALARRLTRLRALATPAPLTPQRAQVIADGVAEAMITAVAKELPAAAAALTTAAQDPASGLTLTFAFAYTNLAAVRDGAPGAPSLTIRPGTHRD